MNTKSKELDFEVDLLPVLSVLSICICFLLTTSVWTRMGFIGINQAIGDELPSSGRNPDSVFLKMKSNGQYLLQWKSGEDASLISEKVLQLSKTKNSSNWDSVRKEISAFIQKTNIKTVIVMPEIGVNYGQAIALIDQLKGLSVNIGLAPAIKGVK